MLPSRGALADDLEAAGVEVLVRALSVLRRELATPGGWPSVIAAAARDAARLAALIRQRDVALVHSNTSVVLGGAAAAARARVPHVWHVREIYSRFGRRGRPTAGCSERAGAAVRLARDRGPVRAQRARPGDPRRARRRAARAPRAVARGALGLDAAAPVIAVLGRISDWKGQDVLVRALAEPALRERARSG